VCWLARKAPTLWQLLAVYQCQKGSIVCPEVDMIVNIA
jgi:hypothetical protein